MKLFLIRALVLINLFCISPLARASILTGEEFLQVNEDGQEAYVSGVVDGFSAGTLTTLMAHAKPKDVDSFLDWYKKCVTGKTPKQMAAILRRYIKNHPNTREDVGVAGDLMNAINESCK